MEPVTLGVMAASLVAAASKKAVDRTADGVVDAGAKAAGKVVAWLRSKLSPHTVLDAAIKYSDSKAAVDELAETIDTQVVSGADKSELQRLIDEVKTEAPQIYQSAIGHHIIQASNSTVQVNWPEH